MSTDKSGRAAQPKGGGTAADEIAAFFKQTTGAQPRLRGVNGVCEFNLEGAGSWRVTVKDGVVSATEGGAKTPPADSVINCAARDFQRILHREGNMNMNTAVLQGLVTATGDIPFALTLVGSFVPEPTGTRP